ncbi:MAG: diaminopimelate epimerase [Bacillota bacterium]
MKFTKMHGLGNDFIILDTFTEDINGEYSSLAVKLCDRHFGIGADGLIFILPSDTADLKMRIINSDGSEAEMCGNGIRCFAKYVYDAGMVKDKTIRVETLAGIIVPEIIEGNTNEIWVKVDMGQPQLERSLIPMAGGEGQAIKEVLSIGDQTFAITAVSMGNPHCVIFLDDLEKIEIKHWGPLLEKHWAFPKKTNVEFVQIVNSRKALMKVWERGAGITLACGTGACAVLVAGVLNGYLDKKAEICLPGGNLDIEWADNGRIYMTGPAAEVFRGELD